MVARTAGGEVVAYPVVETVHTRHICDVTIAPAPISPAAAERIAQLFFRRGIGDGVDGEVAPREIVVERDSKLDLRVPAIRAHIAPKRRHLMEYPPLVEDAHRAELDADGNRLRKRATHLRRLSKALGEKAGQPQWFTMQQRMEALVKNEKKLYPNVDFYSASMFYPLGIPIDLYTPIFAVSRISGWTAHVLEQYANNRLIRPRTDYIGPKYPQTFLPIDQR